MRTSVSLYMSQECWSKLSEPKFPISLEHMQPSDLQISNLFLASCRVFSSFWNCEGEKKATKALFEVFFLAALGLLVIFCLFLIPWRGCRLRFSVSWLYKLCVHLPATWRWITPVAGTAAGGREGGATKGQSRLPLECRYWGSLKNLFDSASSASC